MANEIICMETGEVFTSLQKAAIAAGCSRSAIGYAVKTGTAVRGLHFFRADDPYKIVRPRKRLIRHIPSGNLYEYVAAAAHANGVSDYVVNYSLNGRAAVKIFEYIDNPKWQEYVARYGDKVKA